MKIKTHEKYNINYYASLAVRVRIILRNSIHYSVNRHSRITSLVIHVLIQNKDKMSDSMGKLPYLFLTDINNIYLLFIAKLELHYR